MRIAVGVILVFFLAYIGAWIYVSYNKAAILQKVKKELGSRINGEISIGNIDASFFRTFPRISVALTDVILRDSLWDQHHHDVLQADKVSANLNLFKLFVGNFFVDKIIVEHASAYIFTDSTGYTNTNIFKSRNPSVKSRPAKFPSIEIKNSKIIIEKLNRNKYFSFEIERINADVKKNDPDMPVLFNAAMSVLVRDMDFNKNNGSFLQDKKVTGKFNLQFNPKTKILQFERIRLNIDKHPFVCTGKFFLAEVPAPFTFAVQAENMTYDLAKSLVPLNIHKKLDQYNLTGKINTVHVTLDGTDPESRTPLIRLNLMTKHNDASTPVADFTDCSFTASFTNEYVRGKGHIDENSILQFRSFSGSWQNEKLNCDSIIINNLVHPVLSCDLHSVFNLTAFNDLSDDETIEFTKGKGKLDATYEGSIEYADSIGGNINGNLSLDTATFTYIPRHITLTSCSGNIRLKDKDMDIDQLTAHAGSTELIASGGIKNLLSLINKNGERPTLDCTINSPKLNLNDFTSFLKKRTVTTSNKKKKNVFVKTVIKVMGALSDCDVRLQLKAKQLMYKKFFASNLSTWVIISDDHIAVKDLSLAHAGGVLTLSGSLTNDGKNNSVELHTLMNKMDINKVLTAFDNFNQDAITDKNIKGKIYADVHMTGMINDKAELVPNTLKGTIDFNIRDGELIQFEPVQKISQTAFKNRDFSDIHFGELKDKFDVNGTKIKVNRMEIRSSVLTMFVEGIHDMKNGTDMSIQIPLNNLSNKEDTTLVNKGIHSKTGISLRLRAKTGDDGKLKVSWDPFRKALKAKKG